jgi:hypothetical protein
MGTIGDQIRRFDVELFIIHPIMSPAEITATLGLEAHFSHHAGDPRKTPSGSLLAGTYKNTRWRHCVSYESQDQWFADKITALVDTLVPHRPFFHHIREAGGNAEIIIQFFGNYAGDSLPLATIIKMAELQLDFGIEVFDISAASP